MLENNKLRPTTKDARNYFVEIKNTPPVIESFVRSMFDETLRPYKFIKKNSVSIFSKMRGMILDNGLTRDQSYSFTEKNGETVTAAAEPMLGRQAALYEVKSKIKFHHIKNNRFDTAKQFKALTLDLEKFRKADEAGAADYNLNIVAHAINLARLEIIKIGVDPNDLVLGRYGGDEFYLFLIGSQYDNKLKEIQDLIKKHIKAAYGYFEKNSEPQQFKIKHDKVEVIEIPKDPIEKQIFLSFLSKNSILDENQIAKEKQYLEENPIETVDEDYVGIYPKSIEEIKDHNQKIIAKIEYLVKDHSELKVPFWAALREDKLNNNKNNENVREVLAFYQEYLIDPLLNEIVLGRFDIQDHLDRKEFSRVFVYEAKLKEVNDLLSWTYADERIIKKFWEGKLKKDFREEFQNGTLTVGRIGGSIIIMQKEGKTLSQETLEKLRKIGNEQFKSKYDARRGVLNHEIGFAEIDAIKDTPKEVIDKIFSEPTKNWLRKTFKRVLTDIEEYKKFIHLLGNYDDDPENTISFLSARYFTGNRWQNRAIGAAQILNELNGVAGIDNRKITEILKKLTNIKKRTLEEEKEAENSSVEEKS